MGKINIARTHLQQLQKEFKTSRQTVYTSLWYFNNSETAKSIRARAKELLHQEADAIQITIKNNTL